MAKAWTYCSFCGASYAPDQPWPRVCAACNNTTYRNPLPVSVILLPIESESGLGLLTVRRAIEPRKGQLALPGGFIGMGESWQEAGAREVREETGITIDPATITDWCARSAPEGMVLIFGLAPAIREADLPVFAPNDETEELVIIRAAQTLAFPLHTDAMADWFARQGGR